MGDFRITVEAIGGHGCGRESKDGPIARRNGVAGLAARFIDRRKQ